MACWVATWFEYPLVGPYVAGIIDILPYVCAIGPILQLRDGRSLFAPWNGPIVFGVGITTFFFGLMLGHFLLKDAA